MNAFCRVTADNALITEQITEKKVFSVSRYFKKHKKDKNTTITDIH
jgi:hypothetical protein